LEAAIKESLSEFSIKISRIEGAFIYTASFSTDGYMGEFIMHSTRTLMEDNEGKTNEFQPGENNETTE